MSTGPLPEHHTLTVKTTPDPDEPGLSYLDFVTLECTAPEDAPCRTYPDCGCDTFNHGEEPGIDQHGHPYISGQPCWLEQWFESEPLGQATAFVGNSATDETDCGVPLVDRTGNIKLVGFWDYPEWDWA